MDFEDVQWIAAVWFLSDGETKDILVFLYQDKAGVWQATYRFRYYNSPDPFDKQDKKSWFGLKPKQQDEGTRFQLEKALDSMLEVLKAQGFGDYGPHKVVVDGPPNKLMEMLKDQPWAHLRTEPINGVTATA
jgi:hypothetical protein